MFMFIRIFVQSGNGLCLPQEIQRCCLYIGNLRVSNSFLHQSGRGLGLGLGYVGGCVLGKETLYGSYIPMYGKLRQSGLCFGLWFGLWFGERTTIWILYGQSWQKWAFKQANAWNKLDVSPQILWSINVNHHCPYEVAMIGGIRVYPLYEDTPIWSPTSDGVPRPRFLISFIWASTWGWSKISRSRAALF